MGVKERRRTEQPHPPHAPLRASNMFQGMCLERNCRSSEDILKDGVKFTPYNKARRQTRKREHRSRQNSCRVDCNKRRDSRTGRYSFIISPVGLGRVSRRKALNWCNQNRDENLNCVAVIDALSVNIPRHCPSPRCWR